MIRFQCEKFFKPLHAPLCSFIESRRNRGLIEWDADRATWEITDSVREDQKSQAFDDDDEGKEEDNKNELEPKASSSSKKKNKKKKKKKKRF